MCNECTAGKSIFNAMLQMFGRLNIRNELGRVHFDSAQKLLSPLKNNLISFPHFDMIRMINNSELTSIQTMFVFFFLNILKIRRKFIHNLSIELESFIFFFIYWHFNAPVMWCFYWLLVSFLTICFFFRKIYPFPFLLVSFSFISN